MPASRFVKSKHLITTPRILYYFTLKFFNFPVSSREMLSNFNAKKILHITDRDIFNNETEVQL